MISLRRVVSVGYVALASSILALTTGCGGSFNTTTSTSASPLAGNWLLYGSLPKVVESSSSPDGLAISLDVIGKNIVAAAAVSVSCGSSGPNFGARFGGVITGTIADDGTFTLATPTAGGALNAVSLSISGKAPAIAGASWSGKYSLNMSSGTCAASLSAPFTATSVRDLTGTFAGSGTFQGSLGSPSPVTLGLSLKQGAALELAGSAVGNSRLGLQGTLQVQGISCFTKGSIAAASLSEVQGGPFLATFVMDDGSSVSLDGSIDDVGTSSLDIATLLVNGGSCAGIYTSFSSPLVVKLQP